MIATVLPLGLFRCTRVHLNICVLKYRLCGTVELDLFVWASYYLLNLRQCLTRCYYALACGRQGTLFPRVYVGT